MIHQLKCEPQYFEDIVSGKKPFEIRRNDRGYAVGDFLALNEFDREAGVHTGRCCLVEAVSIMSDARLLKDGCVAIGTKPCVIGRQKDRGMYTDRDEWSVQFYQGGTGIAPAKSPEFPLKPVAVTVPPEEVEKNVTFPGPGSDEKRQLYSRLMRFRKENGVGCLQGLADLSSGTLTVEMLRDALEGKKLAMTVWRSIGKALDLLELGGGEGNA